MASVEKWTPDPKTGKPRYRAHWRTPAGKPQSKVFPTKGAAGRYGNRMEVAKLEGTYVDAKAGRATLKEYGTEWLSAQTFADSTRETVESRLRVHVWPTLGKRPLNGIRPSTVQAWVKGLSCAPSTAGAVLGVVSTILSAAVDDGALAKNPCAARSVKPPKVNAEKVQPFTTEHVAAIVGAHPERFVALSILAMGCGLRQGECFGLAESDIDFLGRWVNVNRQVKIVHGRLRVALPKGGKKRRVPLPQWVGFALAEHLRLSGTHDFEDLPIEPGADNPGGFLFANRAGNPVGRQAYNRFVWKPALKAAELDPTDRRNGMHRCRHTFASVLLTEGESIAAVSEFLGHADPSITLRVYAHMMPRSQDRTRKVIDAAFSAIGCTPVASPASDSG